MAELFEMVASLNDDGGWFWEQERDGGWKESEDIHYYSVFWSYSRGLSNYNRTRLLQTLLFLRMKKKIFRRMANLWWLFQRVRPKA